MSADRTRGFWHVYHVSGPLSLPGQRRVHELLLRIGCIYTLYTSSRLLCAQDFYATCRRLSLNPLSKGPDMSHGQLLCKQSLLVIQPEAARVEACSSGGCPFDHHLLRKGLSGPSSATFHVHMRATLPAELL